MGIFIIFCCFVFSVNQVQLPESSINQQQQPMNQLFGQTLNNLKQNATVLQSLPANLLQTASGSGLLGTTTILPSTSSQHTTNLVQQQNITGSASQSLIIQGQQQQMPQTPAGIQVVNTGNVAAGHQGSTNVFTLNAPTGKLLLQKQVAVGKNVELRSVNDPAQIILTEDGQMKQIQIQPSQLQLQSLNVRATDQQQYSIGVANNVTSSQSGGSGASSGVMTGNHQNHQAGSQHHSTGTSQQPHGVITGIPGVNVGNHIQNLNIVLSQAQVINLVGEPNNMYQSSQPTAVSTSIPQQQHTSIAAINAQNNAGGNVVTTPNEQQKLLVAINGQVVDLESVARAQNWSANKLQELRKQLTGGIQGQQVAMTSSSTGQQHAMHKTVNTVSAGVHGVPVQLMGQIRSASGQSQNNASVNGDKQQYQQQQPSVVQVNIPTAQQVVLSGGTTTQQIPQQLAFQPGMAQSVHQQLSLNQQQASQQSQTLGHQQQMPVAANEQATPQADSNQNGSRQMTAQTQQQVVINKDGKIMTIPLQLFEQIQKIKQGHAQQQQVQAQQVQIQKQQVHTQQLLQGQGQKISLEKFQQTAAGMAQSTGTNVSQIVLTSQGVQNLQVRCF